MHSKTFSLSQLYKILFLLFYIIPILSIGIKLIYGMYDESIAEVWFLGILLMLTAIIFVLPNLTKDNKEKTTYLLVSMIIFIFGLGAIGFKTEYLLVDFSEDAIYQKLPYIIMFGILCLQVIGIIIKINVDHKQTDHSTEVMDNFRMNKVLYVMMSAMVILGYTASIILKRILSIEGKYINFELSVILGYVFLYGCLVIIARFQFKQSLCDALANALFFVPILSIGLGVGILLFNESFISFKLTILIIGSINMVFFMMNLYILKKR